MNALENIDNRLLTLAGLGLLIVCAVGASQGWILSEDKDTIVGAIIGALGTFGIMKGGVR
jgi:hypothetical protein